MKVPNARRLGKEDFVDVCLNVSKKFLQDRSRATPPHMRPPPSNRSSGSFSDREDYLLTKLLEAEVERLVGHTDAALLRLHHRDDHDHYSVPPPLVSADEDMGGNEPISFRHEEEEDCSPAPYAAYAHKSPHSSRTTPRGGTHTTPRRAQVAFSVIHPLQVAAVQFVKQILDPVYARGMLSKNEYTDAVISITTEGFTLAERRGVPLDAAPSEVIDDGSMDAPMMLSEAFQVLLREITDSVALHYTTLGESKMHAANVVAHEAVRTTHAVSIRPKGHAAAGGALQLNIGSGAATRSTNRRSHSLGENSNASSSAHRVVVDEEEAVFDAQVEHIRSLLGQSGGATSAPPPRPPAELRSLAREDEQSPAAAEGDDEETRRRRQQALEGELRLLTIEMNTLAQRAFKIRDELASL